MWFGNNLTNEGIQKIVNILDPKAKKEKQKSPAPEVVTSEWKRLATFMSKRR